MDSLTWTDFLSYFSTNPLPFIGAWGLGGFLSLFLPIIKWNNAKDLYYNMYGQYIEYEHAQKNYNYMNYAYGYPSCGWWQFRCRQDRYVTASQNYGDNQVFIPGWYIFLGGQTEDEQRMQEEMGGQASTPGSLKFVYGWTVILFVALFAYGVYTMYFKKSLSYLAVIMAMMLQYSFLLLLILPQGVIETDNKELEDSVYGWHGQFAVLMVYFNYALILFSSFFLILGAVKYYLEMKYLGESKMLTGDPDAVIMPDDDEPVMADYEAPKPRERFTSTGTPSPSVYKMPLPSDDGDDAEVEEPATPKIVVQHISREPWMD